MHILFYGQETASKRSQSPAARRVALLADYFAKLGHLSEVFVARGSTAVLAHQGVVVKKLSSLDPSRPGGMSYHLSGAFRAVLSQPDVIHAHGWVPATIIRLLSPLMRHSTLVLTVDEMPHGRLSKRSAKVVAAGFDQVTSPSRDVQYQLLMELGVRADYIPEGYEEDVLEHVPAANWKLTPEKYVVILGDAPAEIRKAAKAIRAADRKIRIVIPQEEKGLFKRIKSDIRSVSLVGPLQGRERRSLCAQAALVVLCDNTTASSEVLQLMAAKRPVVAITETRYQELLGITGKVYQSNKVRDLQTVYADIVPNRRKQLALGRSAAIRAERHFSMERIAAEYRLAYRPDRTPVLIDSVRPFAASVASSK